MTAITQPPGKQAMNTPKKRETPENWGVDFLPPEIARDFLNAGNTSEPNPWDFQNNLVVSSSGVVAVALQGSLYSKGDKVLEPKNRWWIFLGLMVLKWASFCWKSYAQKKHPRKSNGWRAPRRWAFGKGGSNFNMAMFGYLKVRFPGRVFVANPPIRSW